MPGRRLAILTIAALFLLPETAAASGVNVYSARSRALIGPLLEEFTEESGISVNLLTAGAGALLGRLVSEGDHTAADLLLTVDAGWLYRAREAGVTAPFPDPSILDGVPRPYRDPEGHWTGLGVRARTVFYASGADVSGLSRYEDLADDKWRGRICIRSSDNIYNQSLVASMVAALGADRTGTWLAGLVRNMARPPAGGDRDQIRAVAAGVCDIAIANTYYVAGMLSSGIDADRAAAGNVRVLWLNQQDRGAHVNISGVALVRNAKNPVQAVRLVRFLLSGKAQAWYATTNGEYPVMPHVDPGPVLGSMGEFRADTLSVALLGKYNAEAVRLMDRAGWK